mmetsp:Transcript_3740/g.8064  ORF Transcript_3740/g.8064 Transcript_3740/m.8064 type:complete len:221 (-) Transcript_3740:182-844(-)
MKRVAALLLSPSVWAKIHISISESGDISGKPSSLAQPHPGDLTSHLHAHPAAASALSEHAHAGSHSHNSFFSQNYDVILLFEWWHPRVPLGYMLSLLVIFLLCILAEWLSWRLRESEHLSRGVTSESVPLTFRCVEADAEMRGVQVRAQIVKGARRFWMRACSVALSFMVMLLVMTMNTGVFCTVVVGISTGRLLFSSCTIVKVGMGSARTEDDPMLCHT